MYLDVLSVSLGAGLGCLAALVVTLPLLRLTWNAYQREQVRVSAGEQREQAQRQAENNRRQEAELLERVTAMLRDILKVRASSDPDDPHPLKSNDLAEVDYLRLVKESADAAAKLDRARYVLNYKNGKG